MIEEPTEQKKTLKEKKKKSKKEDSDSGVEVFFREMDETVSDKKSGKVKVCSLIRSVGCKFP